MVDVRHKKGRRIYVPVELLDEMEIVRQHYGVKKKSEALRRLAEDSDIGRKVKVFLVGRKRSGRL